ncbi:MAG: hypothetical protein N2C14_10650, partial [Planctomycetales bacterium]
MSRESFLDRVRQAAEAGRKYRVFSDGDPLPEGGRVDVGDDPVQRLADEIQAVGGTAQIVSSLSEAKDALAEILRETKPKSVLCWKHELLDRVGLGDLLKASAVEQLD